MNAYAELVLQNPAETWVFRSEELKSVDFNGGGVVIWFEPAGSAFYPLHRVVSYDFFPTGERRVSAVIEEPRMCPAGCGELAVDSGEGRFCPVCYDYEGTCVEDHCLTCGTRT